MLHGKGRGVQTLATIHHGMIHRLSQKFCDDSDCKSLKKKREKKKKAPSLSLETSELHVLQWFEFIQCTTFSTPVKMNKTNIMLGDCNDVEHY